MFYFYFVLFFNLLFDIYFQKKNCNNDFHLTKFNNNYIIFDSSVSSASDSSASDPSASESSASDSSASDSSESCPINCDTCANSTYCYSCKDEKFHGKVCEFNCTENCLEKKCEKDTGVCKGCENGFYSENCTEKCPINCLNKTCGQFSGYCQNCTDQKFYDDKCNKTCNETCKGSKCYINGTCLDCDSNKHLSKDKLSCVNCSESCLNKKCDTTTGICEICISNHYGLECNSTCDGCLNGCEKLSGDCLNNICNNTFYDSQKCNKNCEQTCQDNLCDMFTGECVNKCENNFFWGKYCNESKICNDECKDTSKYPYVTADCCLIKNNYKSTNKIIEIYSYYNKQYDVQMINISSNNQTIPIVIDFNSNANLIIFTEHGVTFKNINDKKKINYNSSLFYKNDTSCVDLNKNLSNYISGINITGNLKKEKFNFTKKNHEYIELNVTYLDPISIDKIDQNYFFSGNIQGFVGLGILSQFIFQLYNDSEISRNIHSIINIDDNNKIIKIGDYTYDIINNPEDLTNIKYEYDENNKYISFVNTNIYKTSLIGVYYNKKIYETKDADENIVTFNFNLYTSIVLPNSYNSFFKLIYFGNYMGKECSVSENLHNIEYTCNENVSVNLPDIGLYFQDYIYYIPKKIFFNVVSNKYKFIISLKENKVKINIGKNFLNHYSLVFKNGFKNISLFNEEKNYYKAYQYDIEMIDINNFSYNIENSYGRKISYIIFCSFGLIILIYLMYLCHKYQNNFCSIDDEEDENESMLELNDR